jgi:aminopeptidase S
LPLFSRKTFRTFTLELNPVMESIMPEGSASATVAIKPSGRGVSTVKLSAGSTPEGGLPAGISVSFSPQLGTPPFDSTMNISTSLKVAPGAYPFLVIAAGEDTEQMATYTLIVRSKKPIVKKIATKKVRASTRKRKSR